MSQIDTSYLRMLINLQMWVDEMGQIQTDLYRKPGTKCQYLRPESAHPRRIFPNIAKSLTHRIVRICSVLGTREVSGDRGGGVPLWGGD